MKYPQKEVNTVESMLTYYDHELQKKKKKRPENDY